MKHPATVMKTIILILSISCTFISCKKNSSVYYISDSDSLLFEQANVNAILANQGFSRCSRYTLAWLSHSDPKTLLIPRNLEKDSDIWNAKDAAADNYPFMVLTSFFVDHDLFTGRMLDMLSSERSITERIGSLPDTYSFSKMDFQKEEVNQGEIIFGASEYIKDGLLPLTEWLGLSPWYDRLIEMLMDLDRLMDVAGDVNESGYGRVPRDEVNGELLQVLSRIYWMTNKEEFLDWAIQIGDFYLLGDHHPTSDLEYLRLRDHGCELVSGLCELYLAVNFAKPEKKAEYQDPLYTMLDRILEVGRNEDGFFYDGINPQTGEIVGSRIADTWGYTLNGFYGVFMIDGKEEYKDAIIKLFSNLHKYRNHDWENGSSDGYADAIESALNLYNRIPDPAVASWINSEMKVMWGKQQPSGIIEGWHGDGNFARTTIMYNLWKSKGLYAKPWRDDLLLGAEQKGDSLLISIQASTPWEGKLYFDKARHRENMYLPVDWPRINQFPEWYIVNSDQEYQLVDLNEKASKAHKGQELKAGMDLKIDGEKWLVIY